MACRRGYEDQRTNLGTRAQAISGIEPVVMQLRLPWESAIRVIMGEVNANQSGRLFAVCFTVGARANINCDITPLSAYDKAY